MPKLVLSLLLFCACVTQAQNFNLAEKYNASSFYFENVLCSDSNYYFVGFGADKDKITLPQWIILKTNFKGDSLNFVYLGDTLSTSFSSSINGLFIKDKKLIISGKYRNDSTFNCPFIATFNEKLNIQKLVLFNQKGYGSIDNSGLYPLVKGGYLQIGGGYKDVNNDENVLITFLDSNFEITRRKEYGNQLMWEKAYSATELPNGNIVIGAHRYEVNTPHNTRKKEQTWIFEIDTAGTLVREFIDPDTQTGPAKGITQTADGGFVYCGNYQTYWNGNSGYDHKPSISKISSSFISKEWEVVYNDTVGGDQSFEKIIEHRNSYIAIGTMFTEYPNDWGLIWGGAIVKFNESGHLFWSKGITSSDSLGNKNYHYFYDVNTDENGNIICAGKVEQIAGPNLGWIVKLDSSGCLTETNCGYPILTINEQNKTGKLSEIQIYPNPFQSTIQLGSNEPITQIKLYNQLGQLVFKQINPEKEISLNHLPEGLYFLHIKTKQGEVVKKVVKY